MGKIRIQYVFIAVLVLSGVTAARASATLWLLRGQSLTGEASSTWHGTFILAHKGGTIGDAQIECTGLLTGTVGPGSWDLTKLVENLTGTEKDLIGNCKTLSGFCFGAIEHPFLLEWSTDLILHSDGTTWDQASGGGGYTILCSFGIMVECHGTVESKFIGNGANGAEFQFEGAAGGEVECSDGGKGSLVGTKADVVLQYTVS